MLDMGQTSRKKLIMALQAENSKDALLKAA